MYIYLCLEEIDEPGQIVLVLSAVSPQVALNDRVACLAHLTVLTVGAAEIELYVYHAFIHQCF